MICLLLHIVTSDSDSPRLSVCLAPPSGRLMTIGQNPFEHELTRASVVRMCLLRLVPVNLLRVSKTAPAK